MTKDTTRNWIKFLSFRDVVLWDVKRYASERIKSDYPIVKLGLHIQEESHKVKLFDFPEEEFGILGVNNKIGIFDAYKEIGANINQAYKKMEVGWLAYNPYRVNVGSIGMRTEEQQHEYISPAYVVFSCKETLLPDFLYKLFKTERFNKIINESTTGSVRQNLTIEILKTLDIALPFIDAQREILKLYYHKAVKAENAERKIIEAKEKIKTILKTELKLKFPEGNGKHKGLSFTKYLNLNRWDFQNTLLFESKYPLVKLSSVLKNISTGTTPPTSRVEYFNGDINFYTPADLGEEIYLTESERKVSQLAVDDKKVRIFPKNTLLFVGIGSTIGKVGLIADEFATSNQQITGLYLDEEQILPEFLYYYFDAFKEITTYEKTQATIPIINQDRIAEIPIPQISKKEQQIISDKILIVREEIKALKEDAELNRKEAIKEFEQAIFKN